MLTEKSIAFELGNYWVCDADNQYTVYCQGVTHSKADSSYAHTEDGLSIAIARCKYLDKRSNYRSNFTVNKDQ
jgi:hypothetical protein